MLRDLAKALLELRQSFGEGCGSYRPDLHYMRGPGPKWHAKYGSLAAKTSDDEASAEPAMRDLAERRA